MIVIGLTGSIGMGKSTVAAMFAHQGIPVFDADAAVHRLQGKEGRLVTAIEAAFAGTTGSDGVDRSLLRAMVMGDATALERLEAIIHPAVAEERAAFLSEHRDAPLVVLDVPLLFETGGDKSVDCSVVVSAAHDVQRKRVLTRPNMTEARLDQILAHQMPDADKRALADHVIATDVPLDETREAVSRLIACITRGEAR